MTDLFERMGHYRRFLAELVVSQAGNSLVLGCGDLPIDGNAIRTDIDRRSSRIHLLADATVLPFETGSFDAVVASEVIEHVPKPYKLMDEVSRVLKPSGVFLLTTPNAAHLLSRLAMTVGAFIEDRTMHEDSIDHRHFFDRRFIRRELRRRFRHVLEFHRFVTLPWFYYVNTSRLPGLCYQLAFVCSGVTYGGS